MFNNNLVSKTSLNNVSRLYTAVIQQYTIKEKFRELIIKKTKVLK